LSLGNGVFPRTPGERSGFLLAQRFDRFRIRKVFASFFEAEQKGWGKTDG
jgi:hypothetical protein